MLFGTGIVTGEVLYLILVVLFLIFFRTFGELINPGFDARKYSLGSRFTWCCWWAWAIWILGAVGQQVPREESTIWSSGGTVSLTAATMIVLSALTRLLIALHKQSKTSTHA